MYVPHSGDIGPNVASAAFSAPRVARSSDCHAGPALAAEPVKVYEAMPLRNYWADSSFSSGLLIQLAVGRAGGVGTLRTKRSGWAA